MAANLTKFTVNLVPRALAALDETSELLEETKTSTVNRALQLYAYVMKRVVTGTRFVQIEHDGESREMVIF